MNLAQLKKTYPNVSFNLPMLAKEFGYLPVRDKKDGDVPMYHRPTRRQLVTGITQPIFWSHEGEQKIDAPILACTIEAQRRMVKAIMMVDPGVTVSQDKYDIEHLNYATTNKQGIS